MRIVLLAWGSRGDVEPMLALGRGLTAAGHHVGVAATRDFAAAVTGAGLAYEPFDFVMAGLFDDPDGRAWLGGQSRQQAEFAAMRRVFAKVAEPMAAGVRSAAAGYDVVLSGLATFDAARAACEALGRRHLHALLFPYVPSRDGRANVYSLLRQRTSSLNWAWTRLLTWSAYPMFARSGDLVRAQLGRPRGREREHWRALLQTPTLVAVSPLVAPPPADRGPTVVHTGWWVSPPAPFTPDANLAAFLAAGEPPVYAGFGSMAVTDPAPTSRLLVEAARRAGRRLILHRGHAGMGDDAAGDDLLAVDSVPHAWLFPRLAGVIHHGGAGTTAAALRAGVPQVAVPHFGDQPYWGRRVAELGVGLPPIPRRRLTSSELADRIRGFGDQSLLRRAADFGKRLQGEDGVATAIEVIERVAG